MVQAFNKIGAGPLSDDVKAYTAEGVPEQPPDKVTCTTLTSQTIRVSWVSPPLTSANGVIKGYKVIYGPADSWFGKLIEFSFSLEINNLEFQMKTLRMLRLLLLVKLFFMFSRNTLITPWKLWHSPQAEMEFVQHQFIVKRNKMVRNFILFEKLKDCC